MRYFRLFAVALIFAVLSTNYIAVRPVEACGNGWSFFERRIDIGGYKLYVHSEGKGKPVVLYDSAYGDTSNTWDSIQHEISREVRSVSYDRAGLGKSDCSPNPRTSAYMVAEWHKLLHKAKIKGPYILVGHSMGCFNVRLFSAMYPGEVAGIVLVDAAHEDQYAKLISTLPVDIQQIINSQFSVEGTLEDFLTSGEQVRATRNSLKNVPLTVITATNHGLGEECEKIWMDLQNDIVSLSNCSKHIIAYGSSHYIQDDRPDIIINAIKDMIKTVNKRHD